MGREPSVSERGAALCCSTEPETIANTEPNLDPGPSTAPTAPRWRCYLSTSKHVTCYEIIGDLDSARIRTEKPSSRADTVLLLRTREGLSAVRTLSGFAKNAIIARASSTIMMI